MTLADLIVAEAQRQNIDPKLALEVATDESNLNQNAVGRSGEIGVFQLLPSSFPGLDLADVNVNIANGVGYLAAMLAKYQNPAAALAAYNWGPTNLDQAMARYGSDWFSHIPASTQAYVAKILGNVSSQYQAAVGPLPVPAALPNLFASATPPPGGMSVWTQVAIAIGVIFGITLLLSDG